MNPARYWLFVLGLVALATAGVVRAERGVPPDPIPTPVAAGIKHAFETHTLKLVGFFPTGAIITEFDEPLAPLGIKTLVTPILEQ